MSTDIIEAERAAIAAPEQAPAGSPMAMAIAALNSGMTPEQIGQMMDLQDRYNAAQAKSQFDEAFALFKNSGATLIGKTKNGHNSRYAPLSEVVKKVTPALSEYGLSSRWDVRDERDWITVTCYLRHTGGHEESVAMGGPIDDKGGKSPIQARASTVTFLQRYTLKAILGVSEEDDDTDGAAIRDFATDGWIDGLKGVETLDALQAHKREGAAYFSRVKDREGLKRFNAAVSQRFNELKGSA